MLTIDENGFKVCSKYLRGSLLDHGISSIIDLKRTCEHSRNDWKCAHPAWDMIASLDIAVEEADKFTTGPLNTCARMRQALPNVQTSNDDGPH